MHPSMEFLFEKRAERAVEALRRNRFDAHLIADPAALLEHLDKHVWRQGATCSVGGSATLEETGVLAYLRSGRWEFYDRYAPGADVGEIFLKSFGADVYFTSANAITEDGRIYNVDGRGNRVAALAYGPKQVVVVAGSNKIVTDLGAARARNRETAAPANAHRLSCPTPCATTGACADCHSEGRICNMELIWNMQPTGGRISVLLLPGHYGF